MDEKTYAFGLAQLRRDWGGVHVDPHNMPGVLRSKNDPLTGVLVGMHAPLFAEIINRALAATDAGWIVGNGMGTRWRTFSGGSPDWTEVREEATRYARREDAELAHEGDEDAWRIVAFADVIGSVSPPPNPRPDFVAWESSPFPDGAIVEIRERDGHEHPMKVGSIQFKNALRELGPRMPVRAATDEQRKGWEPQS
jgi:hypothetical protein